MHNARILGQYLPVSHDLATQYRYNTLNQVVQQKTPDAGLSNFWYDRLGRLVASQNAKQKAVSGTENNRKYSYTQYDPIGRITEVGEYTNPSTTAMSQTLSRDTASLASWLSTNANRKEVTRTIYDKVNSNWTGVTASTMPLFASNLRNRVAYTQYYPAGNPNGLHYNHATYYSYDIHGNVDTLIQDYGNASLGGAYMNMMNNNGLHNRFKKIVYQYDLISGKVNHVAYQPQYVKGSLLYRPADALYHKYEYDAENKITAVYTSTDSIIWEKDAHYDYYKHGPLARTELGEQQVQGLDYAYTIQGWLKGVNSSSLVAAHDMGEDGLPANINKRYVARDAFGFNLNYFNGDYTSINPGSGTLSMPQYSATAGITNALSSGDYRPLYNGNISSMIVNVGKLTIPDATGTGTTYGAMLYNYQYDQLNRLVSMDAFKGLTAASNSWANIISLPHFQERVTYDANGNILTYKRNGNKTSQQLMDDLSYVYKRDGSGKLINNRLRHVTDAITNTSAYDESDAASGVSDIENHATDNYAYDSIGNLIKDTKENITIINWNVYGKITDINFSFVANKVKKIYYSYDASGNRISKRVEKYGATSGATTASDYTWYTRDASGNVMGVYSSAAAGTAIPTAVSVGERHLYGSSRLGVYSLTADSKTLPQISVNNSYISNFVRGNKFFELSNHLGNVLSTISDKKTGVDTTSDGVIDYYTADVMTANDYYPFGMIQPGRKYSQAGKYRYGFNGKENDSEVKGEGNQQDYGMRIYDQRLGRFLSVDPLTKGYPHYTPYSYTGNKPIRFIDLDGAEPTDPVGWVNYQGGKFFEELGNIFNDDKPNEIRNTINAINPVAVLNDHACKILYNKSSTGRPVLPYENPVADLGVDIILYATGERMFKVALAPKTEAAIVEQQFAQNTRATTGSIKTSATEETSKTKSKYLGGAKKDLYSKQNILEANHLPTIKSFEIAGFKIPYNKGSAFQMIFNEHRAFISTGSSKLALAFRNQEANLLKQGKFMEAFDLNAQRIQATYGSKYNEAIGQAREYYQTTIVPQLEKQIKTQAVNN